MPEAALATAQAVEKLGIIGVLALIIFLVAYAAIHFRKELIVAHRENTTLRQMLLIVKIAADGAGAKYDLDGVGDIDKMLKTNA
jgi:hypothetical protein